MWDPDYDPYAELELCKVNINSHQQSFIQVARAFNEMKTVLNDLSQQHLSLTRTIRHQNQLIQQLEAEIRTLKALS